MVLSLDIITRVASGRTWTVLAILYDVDDLNKSTVMSAALVPSIFETISELILNTLPESALFVTIAVAEVPTDWTSVCPIIFVTPTIFGFAILLFYHIYPNIIAIAIAFPVVIPPVAEIVTESEVASVVIDTFVPATRVRVSDVDSAETVD